MCVRRHTNVPQPQRPRPSLLLPSLPCQNFTPVIVEGMEGWVKFGGSWSKWHNVDWGRGKRAREENPDMNLKKKKETGTSVWELQTAFERQNEIPFGILWLGKQLGFILAVGWCVCVFEWEGGAVRGITQAWFGEREEEAWKAWKIPALIQDKANISWHVNVWVWFYSLICCCEQTYLYYNIRWLCFPFSLFPGLTCLDGTPNPQHWFTR